MKLLVSGLVAATATAVVKTGINKDLEKVIELLEEMKEDANKSKNESDVSHAKNMQRLSNAIDEAQQDSDEADSKNKKAIADSELAQAAIDGHVEVIGAAEAEIATQKDNLKALRDQRATAKAAFTATFEDAQLGIVACERLIDALDDIKDKSTAGFFIQEKMKSMPKLGSAKILMQAVAKFNQPQVVYKADDKFKEIVNMIDTLKGELEADLTQVNEEEANSVASHKMAVQNANNVIKNKENEKRENEDGKATQEQNKGDADKEAESQAATKKAADDLHTELSSEKKQAEADNAQATEARDSEIAAIEKAVGILSENATATAGQNTGVTLLQINRAVNEDSKAKALNYLRKQASKLHSKSLLMITEVASQDPFARVKGLITDLIARLEKEAAEAQTKHDKCVKDMKENKDAIAASKAEIKKLTNTIAKETATIEEQNIIIAETTESLEKEAQDRQDGQDHFNTRTAELVEILHDGRATHEALGAALVALNDGHSAAQAGGPNFGGTDGLGSIIQFIEHIQTKQDDANTAYQTEKEDLQDSWKQETRRLDELKEALESEQKTANETKAAAEEAKITAQQSLDDENATMDGLKQAKRDIEKVCVAQGASHAENKEKREAEIQSLKEALEILQDAA